MLVATRLLVSPMNGQSRLYASLLLLLLSERLWIFKQYFVQHMDRPPGLEQDPNYEALTLVTALPLAIWMALRETAAWYRRAGALSAALMSTGVVIGQSRAGIIALAVMAVTVLMFCRRKIITLAVLATAAMLLVALAPANLD